MTIRPARPEDGPAIGKLFAEEGDCPAVDWTQAGIEAWWLVAEQDAVLVGALQLTCSLPTGYIGDLVITRSARAQGLARLLWRHALALLRRAGCQRVAATLRGSDWWIKAVTETEGFMRHDGDVILVSREVSECQ